MIDKINFPFFKVFKRASEITICYSSKIKSFWPLALFGPRQEKKNRLKKIEYFHKFM